MTEEVSSRQRPAPEPALSPLKRAFLALENAQRRIASLEGASREPIAVIGIGCRVPGADNPDALWRLMRDGVDAISAIPPDRFDINALFDPDPETPGAIATRHGGFLRDVDQFDCGFFGIAPREAQGIDPQQRLLLEVSWEALEHAGQAPLRLENSKTGVYFGLCANDYSYLQILSGDRGLLNTHFTSGIAQSVAAGRLSYLLGLQGPSLAVDTACSSSLVGVHLACQALRNGDCRMALAGGVNLILAPELFIALSHSRMLAPDGRCKTFSAAADGFSRSEGCGVVVLKRLLEAKADGDRVLAVIRGTAINQDGPSSALTAPNGPAQEDVIRTALARAGVKPREVGYVEAHGTGTQLGDPLEIQALSAVFRGDRDPATPLVVGSVKTNIGHLEAAAGVTGLIKLILALRHKEIPPHLHMTAPNPHIDWKATPLKVADGLMPWIPIDGRRIGGVSAFGFSGTNAHVVVEEALAETSPRSSTVHVQAGPTPHLFALSARDAPTFAVHARHYAATVCQYEDHDLADVCHTANFGRSHFAERATIIAHTIGELSERLGALERAEQAPGIRRARLARRDLPRVAFVFTGQGSQYSGMARLLNQCCPAFQEAFDRCAALLVPYLSQPLHEVVFSDGVAQADLNNTGYTQPALFAVEYALAETWRSFGVKPSIVAGHSVGEIVAATVAGVLGLEDGIRLVARRSALMATLPAGGTMAAIAASEQDVAAIVGLATDVSIAAVNAPTQTVISGPIAAVDAVCASFAGRGVRYQRLSVSHAFHSSLMDPILEAFEREIQSIAFAAPRLQLVSNLTGRMAGADELMQPRYWRRHLREAVRFGDCVRTIERHKPDCVVEIGPQPTLLSLFGAASTDGPALVPSLRKGCHDWEQMLKGVSALFLAGAEIDWRGVDGPERPQIVDLPTYPFRRERQWFEAKPRPKSIASDSGDHPLLGRSLSSPLPQTQFESRLSGSAPSFIDDHRVGGTVLLPGAAGLEMAVAAAAVVFGPGAHAVEDLELREAMTFMDGDRLVHTIVDPMLNGASRFQILSKLNHLDEWTLHFEGRLRPAAAESFEPVSKVSEITVRCPEVVSIDLLYELLQKRGITLGQRFHVVRELRRGMGEARSCLALGAELARDRGYSIHPVLLDGCLQTAMAALYPNAAPNSLYMPIGVHRFRLFSSLASDGYAHAVLDAGTRPGQPILKANVNFYGPSDDLIAALEGVEFRQVDKDALVEAPGRSGERLYERLWEPAPLSAVARRQLSSWVVLQDRDGIGAALVDALVARGDRCLVQGPAEYGGEEEAAARVAARAWRDECDEISGIIDLRWLDCDSDALRWSPDLALRTSVSRSLSLINAVIAESDGRPTRLWVTTRGAQPAGDIKSPLSPLASAAWGLTWSAALEHPELRAVCLDLDQASDTDEITKLVSELDQDGHEDKVALRGDQRLVARLGRRDRIAAKARMSQDTYRLESAGQGTAEGLVVVPIGRRAPGQGEVEIWVQATGLTFHDVLNVLALRGDAGPLGSECAGEVVRVGHGVQDIREGDRVVAMASGCFASHVIARQEFVQRMPFGFTPQEAAALPVAYLTAGYALEDVARLTDRDRVLIHAAAGGVGVAAIQLALRAGAEIFATAGSEVKRAKLRALGVHHVLDSRHDGFDAEILRLTDGKGVDVVLNSLSGPFIEASFRATGFGGRFIEIGKRGIWSRDQVMGLGRDIDYHIVDLAEVSAREPERIGKLFSRLMKDLADGVLPALPVTPFPLDEVSAAFRHMMKARHIGKIVVSHQSTGPAPIVRPDGQYLVTGGLSGLGLEVAEWLVARGARHISLVGRRGANSPDALDVAGRLTAAGATVTVRAVDVGDEDALGAFLAERRMAGPPLRGVVHAAGVIDDAVFASQDWSRFERVLRPKFGGAWNLDRLTRADVLDWFVMFSSAASLVGAPGQANYAAANTMLDVIAQERRRSGRPGLSVNWGPWGQVGLAASQSMKERLAASGLTPLTTHEALAALETAMGADTAQLGIVAADWTRLLERRDKNSALSPYFSEVVSTKARTETLAAEQKPVVTFRDTLQRAAVGRRRTLVSKFVREMSLRVLGLTEANGPADNTPLSEVGLDSLLAVELRNALAKSLEAALPATLLFDHPTIEALSGFLWSEMCETQAPIKKQEVSDRQTDRVEGSKMLAEVADLSDAEVEILLGATRQ